VIKVSDTYGGKFLSAANVPEQQQQFTITEVGFDRKLQKITISLNNIPKPLALNKTNASKIASVLGDDAEKWAGHSVTICRGKVAFQGEQVDGIVVIGATKSQ
jgi:hypothetical protein